MDKTQDLLFQLINSGFNGIVSCKEILETYSADQISELVIARAVSIFEKMKEIKTKGGENVF